MGPSAPITLAFCSCQAFQEQVWHQGEEDGGALTPGEEAEEVQQVHGCALNCSANNFISKVKKCGFPTELFTKIKHSYNLCYCILEWLIISYKVYRNLNFENKILSYS